MSSTTTTSGPATPPLAGPITDINTNLELLRDFVDTLDTFLAAKREESISTHKEALIPLLLAFEKARKIDNRLELPALTAEAVAFLKQRYPNADAAEVTTSPDGKVSITLQLGDEQDPGEAVRAIFRATGRTKMLYSSSLMNLASSVELFFSKLLHLYFARHPEAVGSKEKIFSFEDLSAFANIAEARAHHVLSKIEDVLRGSINDWLTYLKTVIKLSMGYLGDDQPALEETFQRRNLVVHNGGLVNSIYLSKVSREFRAKANVGDDLAPDRAYLHERIDLWERACSLIGAELWKQLAPNDVERAGTLITLAYKHLLAGRWRVAEALSEFVMRDKKMPESSIMSAQLNYWQARKRRGDWGAVREEVEQADFSAKGDLYQLARYALLERADDFFALLPRALQAAALSEQELREWPVFADMRGDARYSQYAPAPTKRRRASATKRRKALPSNGDA